MVYKPVGPKTANFAEQDDLETPSISDIQDEELLILVIEVGHRREVYRTKLVTPPILNLIICRVRLRTCIRLRIVAAGHQVHFLT